MCTQRSYIRHTGTRAPGQYAWLRSSFPPLLQINMLSLKSQLPRLQRLPLYTRAFSVKFSENFNGMLPQPTKPKLRDFRYPLFHSFLLASSVYMGLNCWWYALEYEQVENGLVREANELEAKLHKALEEVKEEHELHSSRTWFSRIKFWR